MSKDIAAEVINFVRDDFPRYTISAQRGLEYYLPEDVVEPTD